MRLGKILISCGVASVLVLGANLFSSKQAEAQSIPACRNIQPRPRQVCYTEHPYSARQKDEGGTKDWSFIVERWAPNFIIVDYEVLPPNSRFGSASLPTGSIVSATGNASIIQESTRQIETLGETKSQLKGKVQGCYPPVCGQLQGQIERVDREIERLSSTQRTAIAAGGNEKIIFTHKTSVSCRKILGVQSCKGGASIEGKVRVNQRYLGDPNSLRQASLSLVEQSRALLQQASTPVPPTPAPVPPTPTPSLTVGALQHQFSGKCLQIMAQNRENGSPVSIGDCTNGMNQLWKLTADGQLQNLMGGKCLQTMGQDRENGSPVSIWDCTNTSNQLWQRTSNGEFRNSFSGKCLQTMGQDRETGSPVSVWDCTNTTNQFWR